MNIRIPCRDCVRLKNLSPALAWMMYCFSQVAYEDDRTYIISSINDSTHLENSKHYRDMAFDFFSLDFKNNAEKEALRDKLTNRLNEHFPGKFYVLLENEGVNNEHFHVQVAKGQVFP